VAAFASFVPHFAQQPHIFNPKESLPFTHYITFRSFRYTPLSFTTFIRSDKPSSDPAKETSLHAKTPPALLRLPPCSLRFATLRTPCQPPSLHSQRLRLTLRRWESTPLSLRRFPTASLLKAAFPALFSAVTAPTQSSAYKKWRWISFLLNLFCSILDTRYKPY
jgi:hypothetical protein